MLTKCDFFFVCKYTLFTQINSFRHFLSLPSTFFHRTLCSEWLKSQRSSIVKSYSNMRIMSMNTNNSVSSQLTQPSQPAGPLHLRWHLSVSLLPPRSGERLFTSLYAHRCLCSAAPSWLCASVFLGDNIIACFTELEALNVSISLTDDRLILRFLFISSKPVQSRQQVFASTWTGVWGSRFHFK